MKTYLYRTFAFLSLLLTVSAYAEPIKLPAIKAGTVVMANLNTPLDSDNPNALIIATINHGKFKGAQLTGQLIENTLRFSSIKHNGKTIKAKGFEAYAIDFDEARIVSISRPEYAELQREATALASSFISAYSARDKVQLGTGTEFGVLIMSDI